ncbi:MAG TPA: TetR/AcrR family transcriptional regulator [Anaerolineae bacterium]|nr:TetR/AcrR family transcriptional regulator [Anaerolineae bacterium]
MSNQPLNEVILTQASQLFREQGYSATTIKQIAKAAGCTNAALYYYYAGGKEQILHEVIQHSVAADPVELTAVPHATSLTQYLTLLSLKLKETMPQLTDRVNWIMIQFPNLPPEQKQFIQNQHLRFHHALHLQIKRFVPDENQADQLAWLVFCAFFGYQQLFIKMNLAPQASITDETYVQFLIDTVTTAHGS